MPHQPSFDPQPQDEPPVYEEPLTPYPGPPLQPSVEYLSLVQPSPLPQQTPYPTPVAPQPQLPQRPLQPQPPPMRRRPQRPPVRQPSQRTGLSGLHVWIAVAIVLAIIVAVLGTQNVLVNTLIHETYSTNNTFPTATPTPAPSPLSSHGIEQYSLLLAQHSGASGSHLSSYYDSRSESLAITDPIGLSEKSSIGTRTVLTDCFDIEKAIWQGKIPNLETVTVTIIVPIGNSSTSPIAICTLNKNTEQQFDWDILTSGQAWEKYNYIWILPGLLQG